MKNISNQRGLTDEEIFTNEEIIKVKNDQSEYQELVQQCSRSQSPQPGADRDYHQELKNLYQTKEQIQKRRENRNLAKELNTQYIIELTQQMNEQFQLKFDNFFIQQQLIQQQKRSDPTENINTTLKDCIQFTIQNFQEKQIEFQNQYLIELDEKIRDPNLGLNQRYARDLDALIDNTIDKQWVLQTRYDQIFQPLRSDTQLPIKTEFKVTYDESSKNSSNKGQRSDKTAEPNGKWRQVEMELLAAFVKDGQNKNGKLDFLMLSDNIQRSVGVFRSVGACRKKCGDFLQAVQVSGLSQEDVAKINQWFADNKPNSQYINQEIAQQIDPKITSSQIVQFQNIMNNQYKYREKEQTYSTHFSVSSDVCSNDAGGNVIDKLTQLLLKNWSQVEIDYVTYWAEHAISEEIDEQTAKSMNINKNVEEIVKYLKMNNIQCKLWSQQINHFYLTDFRAKK
ncbi:Hypothetical_protein [Hexamita inflata]|uniref:Hypothetical_protein n=1 Tax=Hexamita inflata TaxID=28002 RepID=A0AA86PWK8_9EUKA|nr:Hypothetical protein HINF_LOCUS30280 [Hexamita inflata]